MLDRVRAARPGVRREESEVGDLVHVGHHLLPIRLVRHHPLVNAGSVFRYDRANLRQRRSKSDQRLARGLVVRELSVDVSGRRRGCAHEDRGLHGAVQPAAVRGGVGLHQGRGCEAVEIGVGGYPGTGPRDAAALLEDDAARSGSRMPSPPAGWRSARSPATATRSIRGARSRRRTTATTATRCSSPRSSGCRR